MTTKKAIPSRDGQVVLDSLQNAVTKTLKKKKQLGQYAVIWQEGKPMIIGGETGKPHGWSCLRGKSQSGEGGCRSEKSR